ncbi:nuclear transport factor 2 family protein [Pelagibius litoralis]|uniref:nuclear transport factor 2 family protein n=1 Tax=Pelagibius litoralis TaxID=374515 RepID=UPI00197D0C1D|nr:nuclear transport factor 2 family protein [Pelagibius litoralis]
MTSAEVVLAFATAVFINFNADAASELMKPDYIQHNPAVPTGAAPIIELIPALKESGIMIEPHRVIAEGDMVVVHSTYRNAQLFGGKNACSI